MGIIKDIVDIIVPNAQNKIRNEGITSKEALYGEFEKTGYMSKEKASEDSVSKEFINWRDKA